LACRSSSSRAHHPHRRTLQLPATPAPLIGHCGERWTRAGPPVLVDATPIRGTFRSMCRCAKGVCALRDPRTRFRHTRARFPAVADRRHRAADGGGRSVHQEPGAGDRAPGRRGGSLR
jgi:hypothetical protein